MKVCVAVQISAKDGPANEVVIQNLKNVGFGEQVDTIGDMHLHL